MRSEGLYQLLLVALASCYLLNAKLSTNTKLASWASWIHRPWLWVLRSLARMLSLIDVASRRTSCCSGASWITCNTGARSQCLCLLGTCKASSSTTTMRISFCCMSQFSEDYCLFRMREMVVLEAECSCCRELGCRVWLSFRSFGVYTVGATSVTTNGKT